MAKSYFSMKEGFFLETFTAQQHLTTMMNFFLVPICELANCSYINLRFEKWIWRKKEEATKFVHHQQNRQRERSKGIRDRLICHRWVNWSLPRQRKMLFAVANSSIAKSFWTIQEKMNFESFGLWVINEQNA